MDSFVIICHRKKKGKCTKMTETNKINRTIKIYPIFYGLTADLIFWIAINTLFLTTVKNLSAAEINSIDTIGTAVGIGFQFFLIKIVRKIGNIKSVRLGTTLLFLSVVLNTFSTAYWGFLIAEICYVVGFVFKHMDNVILIKDLKYMNKSEEYVKLQTRGNTIYSFVTLVISLISGFLFNVNPYIPMAICMIICFINILLTFLFYEAPIDYEKEETKNQKHNFSKLVLLMFALYGLFYAMIALGQKNSKLFIQQDLQEFLSLDKVAIYMSVIIFISRLSRLTSNLVFLKVYNKLKNKTLLLLEILLTTSFALLLIGNFVGRNMIGIIIMAIGFFTFLLIRDPFDTYMRKTLFANSESKNHDKIINYITLSRKICSLIYGIIVSTMLLKLNYVYVMTLLLILSGLFIGLVVKIYNILEKKKIENVKE